jgi:hypothetical protein
MALTTFDGPIRSGSVKYGAVTAVNAGLVVLSQTASIAFGAIKTSPTAQALFTLPAGSKIVRFNVEVTTALTTATNCGVVIGTSGTSNLYLTTFNTGATAVKVSTATVDAQLQVAQTNNIGTADVTLYGTFTAATADATAGAIVVTVEYIQRLSDGTSVPGGATAAQLP